MSAPRHLWTGEWRSESDRARAEAEAAAATREPVAPRRAEPTGAGPGAPPDPGERAPSGRSTLVLALIVAVVAAVAGAFAAGLLLDGRNNSPDPLPAFSSRPVRPGSGQTRAGAIYAAASPAVVSVLTQSGSGTGFLISRKGTIVTNAHVVGRSNHVVVRFGEDGSTIDADVLGVDESTDLAVVSIDPDRVPKGVRPLRFADSRSVQIGDLAVAIGNPFGLERTATEGIISGLGRSIQAPNGFEIDEVIQTDAPINPGNSGGPLLDTGAHVIGVNSQIATAGTPGNVGIGFAVPSNTARVIVPRLERGETIPRPWLGVRTSPTSPTSPNGAQVEAVVPGSPAERAGVRTGDIIKRVGSETVMDPSDVSGAISDLRPGDDVEIVVQRGASTETLRAELGTRPATSP